MKKYNPRGEKQKSIHTRHFGLHFTLDGYLANPRELDDPALIMRLLTDLPGRMGMKPLIPPYVVRAPENRKKDPGGYSGFVIIQESHLSVHTFPGRRFVSIDVYSCKDFDPSKIRRYFQRAFGIRKIETNLIVRGKEYPLADLA